MPIYTYRCGNCGVQFDRRQRFDDPPLIRCPECNKKALRKVFTPVGIVFKGSGFYATDHRSPSGTGRTQSEEKADESKSETKTEAKKESDSSKTAKAKKD